MKFFCVDSPFVEHCSIEALEKIPGGVRSRVRLKPELMNSWGGAHGGLMSTLLDASMTVAARYEAHEDGLTPVSTVDLSVSFIGQAKSEIQCEAKVTSRRGSTIYMEARLTNESGDVVARSIGTFKIHK